MGLNSTYAKSRRTSTIFAAILCAVLTSVAANSHAQSAQQRPEPGTQRDAAAQSLAGQPATSEANQASVTAVPAARKAAAPRRDPYFVERPQPAAVAALIAAGILVVLLIAAGILLIVRGLREDMRNRKRSYRRRSRRIDARSSRPPIAPAS
jgi:hypothetical protein